MASLSNNQVLALLAEPKAGQTKVIKVWIKIYEDPNCDHIFTTEKRDVKTSLFGSFTGKTGSKRRSRKGIVRTLPNGRRYYVNPAMGGETEVVAYKV